MQRFAPASHHLVTALAVGGLLALLLAVAIGMPAEATAAGALALGAPRLTRTGTEPVGQRVWTVQVDGREVGIVGDEIGFDGSRLATRPTWWAALRLNPDPGAAATWSTRGQRLRTRAAAVQALLDAYSQHAP